MAAHDEMRYILKNPRSKRRPATKPLVIVNIRFGKQIGEDYWKKYQRILLIRLINNFFPQGMERSAYLR